MVLLFALSSSPDRIIFQTVIIDSCHSGGMGRVSDLENARFLPPPDSPFPKGLDVKIWNWNEEILDSLPSAVLDVHLPYLSHNPHVLLTACLAEEVASETASQDGSYSGAFTTLLLTVLKRCNLAQTTYLHLSDILLHPDNTLAKQTPCVDGVNKTRILFSTTDFGRNTFSLSWNEDGTFSVAAGSIHGVDLETEFAITSGKDCFILTPGTVSPLTCTFSRPSDKLRVVGSRAEITKWNRPHLKVFFRQPTSRLSVSVDHQDADVAFSLSSNGDILLERRDSLLLHYAEHFISIPSTNISAIFDAVSHFNFYVYHQSKSNFVGKDLSVELERIAIIGDPNENRPNVYGPATPPLDFFTSKDSQHLKEHNLVTGSAKITDFESLFCLTIRSEYESALYPYVFLFDPATYEIEVCELQYWHKTCSLSCFQCFYHPDDEVAPLKKERIVSVGYGDKGGDPFKFNKDEITFFKIFVTSKYVDMSSISQGSPFSKRGCRPSKTPLVPGEFWESWIYIVGT